VGHFSGKTNYEAFNAAPANTHNQLPGFGYDAAGNLVQNFPATPPPYVYDDQNRLTSDRLNPGPPKTDGSGSWI
jgi:hypothetical protein